MKFTVAQYVEYNDGSGHYWLSSHAETSGGFHETTIRLQMLNSLFGKQTELDPVTIVRIHDKSYIKNDVVHIRTGNKPPDHIYRVGWQTQEVK